MWFGNITPEVGDFGETKGLILQNEFTEVDLKCAASIGDFDFTIFEDMDGYGESVAHIDFPSEFSIALYAKITGAEVSNIEGFYPLLWVGENAYSGKRFGIYLYAPEGYGQLSVAVISENENYGVTSCFSTSSYVATDAIINAMLIFSFTKADGITTFYEVVAVDSDAMTNGNINPCSGVMKLGPIDRDGLTIEYHDLRIYNKTLEEAEAAVIVGEWGT